MTKWTYHLTNVEPDCRGIPDTIWDSQVYISSKVFLELCRDIEYISKSIFIRVKESGMKCSSCGEVANVRRRFRAQKLGRYTLDHFSKERKSLQSTNTSSNTRSRTARNHNTPGNADEQQTSRESDDSDDSKADSGESSSDTGDSDHSEREDKVVQVLVRKRIQHFVSSAHVLRAAQAAVELSEHIQIDLAEKTPLHVSSGCVCSACIG